MSSSISEQHIQLKEAWDKYLVAEWGGEVSFNRARLEARISAPKTDPMLPLQDREHSIWLIAYILWNLFFAGFLNRKGALDIEYRPE